MLFKDMKQKNIKAIANLQMLIALRLDEKNRLEKIIANEDESAADKSITRARLAALERDDAADLAELVRLKADQ
jgi:anti-sigma-K factor RskA